MEKQANIIITSSLYSDSLELDIESNVIVSDSLIEEVMIPSFEIFENMYLNTPFIQIHGSSYRERQLERQLERQEDRQFRARQTRQARQARTLRDTSSLDSDEATRQLYIQLYEKGLLSAETVLNAFGIDEESNFYSNEE